MCRCNICDRTLSPEEIRFNNDHEEFDPCGTCLMAIAEIFGEGDVDSEEEIDEQLELELEDGIPDFDPEALPF